MKFSFYVFLFLQLITTYVLAQNSDVQALIEKADQFTNTDFNYNEALNTLIKAEKMDSTNSEILERISRNLVLIGNNLPENTPEREEKQEQYYKNACTYADEAIKYAPGESVNYLRRAIANGKIALFKGVFSVADVVDQVRSDAEKAVQLNNGTKETIATAHYVLARTHAKISEKWKPARSVLGLGWADIDSALVHYDKAVKIRPGFMMYYIDYARALIREDEYEKAREMLKKVPDCKIQESDDKARIKEAKDLLEEIKDE